MHDVYLQAPYMYIWAFAAFVYPVLHAAAGCMLLLHTLLLHLKPVIWPHVDISLAHSHTAGCIQLCYAILLLVLSCAPSEELSHACRPKVPRIPRTLALLTFWLSHPSKPYLVGGLLVCWTYLFSPVACAKTQLHSAWNFAGTAATNTQAAQDAARSELNRAGSAAARAAGLAPGPQLQSLSYITEPLDPVTPVRSMFD